MEKRIHHLKEIPFISGQWHRPDSGTLFDKTGQNIFQNRIGERSSGHLIVMFRHFFFEVTDCSGLPLFLKRRIRIHSHQSR